MTQKLRHLTVTAAEMTASCAYCTLQVQQTVSPSRVLVRRWLTTAVLTQDHIRDQEQTCQVQNPLLSVSSYKGLPFLQAEARLMFSRSSLASNRLRQVWLGLPGGRFQSGWSSWLLPRLRDPQTRGWKSCADNVQI